METVVIEFSKRALVPMAASAGWGIGELQSGHSLFWLIPISLTVAMLFGTATLVVRVKRRTINEK
jgi:hypothetical protein